MKKSKFCVKGDDDRTPGGGKYRRGRYDLVVLDPRFVSRHSYSQVKCQKYSEFKHEVFPQLICDSPIVLYAVEFVFIRDTIKPSRGEDRFKAANGFVAEILQDSAKLDASAEIGGFLAKAQLLAFTKGTEGEILEVIQQGVQHAPRVM